jgi:hypothetical protein
MLRKVLVYVIVIAFALTLLPMGLVMATSGDSATALQQFNNSLADQQKGVLLRDIWNFVVVEAANGQSVSVSGVYNKIKQEMGNTAFTNAVDESGGTPGDNKISKQTLETIIQKIINNKDTLADYYNTFKYIVTDGIVKDKLIQYTDPYTDTPTDGDLFVALKHFAFPVYTSSSGSFVRNGEMVPKILELGISQNSIDTIVTLLGASINSVVDYYAIKANQNMISNSVSFSDAVFALNLYGLYYDSTATPTPTAAPIATPTPTTAPITTAAATPTATPIPVIPTATPTVAPTTSSSPDSVKDAITNLTNITDETSAETALGNVDDLIKSLGTSTGNAGNQSDQANTTTQAVNLLNAASDAMSFITDSQVAVNTAVDIIKSTTDIVKNSASSEMSMNEITTAVMKVADAAMKTVVSETVDSKTAGTTATASIDTQKAQQLSDKIDAIVQKAKKLNDELKAGKIEAKVESVLTIDVVSSSDNKEDIKKVNTEFPASLLDSAKDKKIDKIAVDTGIAKIALAPDSFQTKTSQKVEISAEKVDKSDMSEAFKTAVGNNQVYDFNISVGDTKITTFKTPLEISLPYELKADENSDKITVFYINSDNKLENVIGIYDKDTKTVKFATSHLSKYLVKVNNVTFKDIAGMKWAKNYIEVLASKGIVSAVGKDTFKPNSYITNAQFITMLVNALKLNDTTATCKFTDIKKANSFYVSVASAVKAGIISDKTSKKFTPNGNMTKQDMAVIIATAMVKVKGKTLPDETGKYLSKYKDIKQIAKTSEKAVALIEEYGVMSDKIKNTFTPKVKVTRAQTTEALYNLFFMK